MNEKDAILKEYERDCGNMRAHEENVMRGMQNAANSDRSTEYYAGMRNANPSCESVRFGERNNDDMAPGIGLYLLSAAGVVAIIGWGTYGLYMIADWLVP
jgi:hypothetical protein